MKNGVAEKIRNAVFHKGRAPLLPVAVTATAATTTTAVVIPRRAVVGAKIGAAHVVVGQAVVAHRRRFILRLVVAVAAIAVAIGEVVHQRFARDDAGADRRTRRQSADDARADTTALHRLAITGAHLAGIAARYRTGAVAAAHRCGTVRGRRVAARHEARHDDDEYTQQQHQYQDATQAATVRRRRLLVHHRRARIRNWTALLRRRGVVAGDQLAQVGDGAGFFTG